MNRTNVLFAAAVGGLLPAALVALAPLAQAVSTREFRLDTPTELAEGELDGTAVLSSGAVVRGVEVRRIDLADVPVAWCLARVDDQVFVGTGNEGRVYRLRGETLEPFAETGQLLVSALAASPAGDLYAGTLPEGRIYRIDSSGDATELTRPEGVEHVWDLAWDDQRNVLFAATGPEGKLFAVDRQGRADVFWDSDQTHVMTVALEGSDVYAGTSGDAVLVRLDGPGRAQVVYDFPGNELTDVDVRDGVVVVAANEFPDPPRVTPTKSRRTPARPRPGKGRLWRVGADGRSERLFSNDEGHFTRVQLGEDGFIYVATGKEGRIYRVGDDQTSAMWIDVDERQVLDFDFRRPNPLFLTGDAGALYRVVGATAENSVWTSGVLDAAFTSRFGELTWRATGPMEFQTRSGNREEPDETWSAWSAPLRTGGPIRSPGARFLQIRARFLPGTDQPALHAVTAFYLPQNQRTRVHDIRVQLATRSTKNKNKAARFEPPRPTTRYKVEWSVDNPDEDRVRYRLRYRQEAQEVWREVLPEHEPLFEDEYEWDTSGLQDGWYVLEVSASDEASNPSPLTLVGRTQSEPILIDNHPPALRGLVAAGTVVRGEAVDSLGPISRLEQKVDGGDWQLFFPDDDFLDTAVERFEVDVGPLEPGPHVVAVRATDAGGNAVVSEVSVVLR